MRRFLPGLLVAPAPLVIAASVAAAQAGTIVGSVVDSLSRAPLAGSTVRARTAAGARVRATSNGRGWFILSVAPGSYSVEIAAIGYAPRQVDSVEVVEGQRRLLAVALERVQRLDERVVTPARSDETALDAATALTTIDEPELNRRLTPDGPLGQLEDVPGMDVARKGLEQSTLSARGPSNANSSALLVLSDYRLAGVPALRLNVPYLIPTATEDLDRIEVVRGPGSAVYGPDADRGVVHLLTRSPLDAPGSGFSLTGGERSFIDASFHRAQRFGSRLGVRMTAAYARGDDWPAHDSAEVVARDPGTSRAAADVRVDWQVASRSRVTASAGLADAIRMVDLTDVGAIQLRDWRYAYAQARLASGSFLANLFLDATNAGSSFQLRTGAPIVDDSRTLAVQLQHGTNLGARVSLGYGVDLQRVVPRTGGTVDGRNEDDDDLTQLGAYAHATVHGSSHLAVIAAARVDHHSRLDDIALSPRVGLVLQPDRRHGLRVTVNRGTSTPTAADLFIDLPVGTLDPSLPYTLRTAGALHPYTFRRDCGGAGGLCMRSPFTPGAEGGPAAYLPADATLLWPVVQSIVGPALAGVPPPSAQDVPSVLAVLDPNGGKFVAAAPGAVTDVPAARRSFTSTIEAGYRGRVGRAFTATFDIYRTHVSSIGSALSVQTPNVFLDADALSAYLQRQGMSPAEATAVAGKVAMVPLGTISPVEARDPTDILLVPRQGMPASYWGLDVSLDAALTPTLSAVGSYSWVDRDFFAGAAGLADAALNAPRHKGSVALVWIVPRTRMDGELRARIRTAFPVRSGVYQGEVSGFTEVDATIGCIVPWAANVKVTVAALNVFDQRHSEFLGAPEIGRQILARARVSF